MLDNIVILGSQLAGTRHAAPVQLAEALATRHSVLYVEPFGYTTQSDTTDDYRACHTSLRQSSAGVKVLAPLAQLLPSPTFYRWLMLGMVERINATRIVEELEWALRTLHIEEYALLIDTPSLRNSIVVEMLSPRTLYLMRWQAWEWERSAEAGEAYDTDEQEIAVRLIERCDAVLATSVGLAALPHRHNPYTFNISGGLADITTTPSAEMWHKAARRVDAVADLLERTEHPTGRNIRRKRRVLS